MITHLEIGLYIIQNSFKPQNEFLSVPVQYLLQIIAPGIHVKLPFRLLEIFHINWYTLYMQTLTTSCQLMCPCMKCFFLQKMTFCLSAFERGTLRYDIGISGESISSFVFGRANQIRLPANSQSPCLMDQILPQLVWLTHCNLFDTSSMIIGFPSKRTMTTDPQLPTKTLQPSYVQGT